MYLSQTLHIPPQLLAAIQVKNEETTAVSTSTEDTTAVTSSSVMMASTKKTSAIPAEDSILAVEKLVTSEAALIDTNNVITITETETIAATTSSAT